MMQRYRCLEIVYAFNYHLSVSKECHPHFNYVRIIEQLSELLYMCKI